MDVTPEQKLAAIAVQLDGAYRAALALTDADRALRDGPGFTAVCDGAARFATGTSPAIQALFRAMQAPGRAELYDYEREHYSGGMAAPARPVRRAAGRKVR